MPSYLIYSSGRIDSGKDNVLFNRIHVEGIRLAAI